MKKYPKIVYVQIENEGTNDEFLDTEKKPEDVIRDGEVAVYELKEIKIKSTKHLIE